MLFDTHTHVNFQPFQSDYQEVIARALAAGVIINNVGSQWESSQRSVAIAKEYAEGVWASVGLHPIHLFQDIVEEQIIEGEVQRIRTRSEVFDYEHYKALAQSSPKVIGIGECGLDYYHFTRANLQERRNELIELQKNVLREHITLALELNLAVIIHCRDAAVHTDSTVAAFDDLYEILQEYNGRVRGVVHCYTGTAKYIPKFVELGLHIGYTGIVSFPNALEVQAALKVTPLERIVLETDAPYLTPQPFRGKRNEPAYVVHVAQAAAALRGITLEEISKQTTQNAFELFGLS